MKNAILSIVVGSILATALGYADDKAAVMALGQQKYIVCAACHGMDGKGMQPVPGMSMAASWVDSQIMRKSSAEVIAAIMMRGIKKENPAEYMGQMMTGWGATMTDEDVAAIITYVRNQFAGHDELVTAAKVKEWRAKYPTADGPLERAKINEMAGLK
jgi:mono/diheme cytochrome c family protein